MKKVKILAPLFVLIVVMSCMYPINDPTGMAPCPDCNQPTTCYETRDVNGQQFTVAVPCGSDIGDPGLPGPPFTSPVTPKIYCTPSNLPTAPKQGQVFKIAASGCLSNIYYYTCADGWIIPVTSIYGAPPTTNLYSGLHYATSYNGTSITYVYLVNFAGNPTGWYYEVLDVRSTGCQTPCPTCVI
jgi:hypothetical protein